MAWNIYDSNGILKTVVPIVPASGITGTLGVSHGGTGNTTATGTGQVALDTAPTLATPVLTSPVLNTGVSGSAVDTDGTLAANSDTKIPSQKAVKTYAASLGTLYAALASANTFLGANNFSSGSMIAPVTASVLATTEGAWKWDNTDKIMKFYDGTRERAMGAWGFQAWAHQFGFSMATASAAGLALAANGGTCVVQIILNAHMLLDEVRVVNSDTTLARTWGWDLYADLSNTANAIARVASCSVNITFTAAALSSRTITASSAPVYLPPGVYWLAIQNRHATNTFGLSGVGALSSLANVTCKTKTTSNPNGATLDMVAATWTGNSQTISTVLRGRVAGDTVVW